MSCAHADEDRNQQAIRDSKHARGDQCKSLMFKSNRSVTGSCCQKLRYLA